MNSGVVARPGAVIRLRHAHDEPAPCTARSALVAIAIAAAGAPLY